MRGGVTSVAMVLAMSFGADRAEVSAHAAMRVDRVVVKKSRRQLCLMYRDSLVKKYRVALGKDPVGPKVRRGDGRTPEGTYRISGRNPRSKYHLSLRISYPDARDRARADSLGVSPGGDIMIHGLKNGYEWIGSRHRQRDWTLGCIAVTNREIEELWEAVPDGTPIVIEP